MTIAISLAVVLATVTAPLTRAPKATTAPAVQAPNLETEADNRSGEAAASRSPDEAPVAGDTAGEAAENGAFEGMWTGYAICGRDVVALTLDLSQQDSQIRGTATIGAETRPITGATLGGSAAVRGHRDGATLRIDASIRPGDGGLSAAMYDDGTACSAKLTRPTPSEQS